MNVDWRDDSTCRACWQSAQSPARDSGLVSAIDREAASAQAPGLAVTLVCFFRGTREEYRSRYRRVRLIAFLGFGGFLPLYFSTTKWWDMRTRSPRSSRSIFDSRARTHA